MVLTASHAVYDRKMGKVERRNRAKERLRILRCKDVSRFERAMVHHLTLEEAHEMSRQNRRVELLGSPVSRREKRDAGDIAMHVTVSIMVKNTSIISCLFERPRKGPMETVLRQNECLRSEALHV